MLIDDDSSLHPKSLQSNYSLRLFLLTGNGVDINDIARTLWHNRNNIVKRT